MLGSGLGAGDWKKLEMIPDLMDLTAQWRGNKKASNKGIKQL